MDKSEFNRREFQRLTGAALGGMLIGAGALKSSLLAADAPSNPLLGDPHVCRGLNTCKGKSADKKNSCAGTGSCATADKHTCHASNACKGQGGCGAHPGENACKGQGECAVPLKANTWTKARKRYEELMKAGGKTFGAAPKKSG
jgi:hypothetical protein